MRFSLTVPLGERVESTRFQAQDERPYPQLPGSGPGMARPSSGRKDTMDRQTPSFNAPTSSGQGKQDRVEVGGVVGDRGRLISLPLLFPNYILQKVLVVSVLT